MQGCAGLPEYVPQKSSLTTDPVKLWARETAGAQARIGILYVNPQQDPGEVAWGNANGISGRWLGLRNDDDIRAIVCLLCRPAMGSATRVSSGRTYGFTLPGSGAICASYRLPIITVGASSWYTT